MVRLSRDAPQTIEERREQYQWALNTLRLGQSGNRAALHAELHRQENSVIDMLPAHLQEQIRSTT